MQRAGRPFDSRHGLWPWARSGFCPTGAGGGTTGSARGAPQAAWLGMVVAGIVLSGTATATGTVEEGEELVGMPAPAWTVTTWINSQPLALAKLRGQVVLLRWWTAPGCPFCEASAPYLSQWQERYAPQGLVVIGMYHPKPPGRIPVDVVKTLAQGLGMTFPLAIDPEWETLRRYWLDGREHAWTSVSFLIDREGIIRYVHPGGAYSPEEAQDIEAMIQELLSRSHETDV